MGHMTPATIYELFGGRPGEREEPFLDDVDSAAGFACENAVREASSGDDAFWTELAQRLHRLVAASPEGGAESLNASQNEDCQL